MTTTPQTSARPSTRPPVAARLLPSRPGPSRAKWDAIVVGAGPAGSSAASILGAKKKRVLIVEKASFPREKTCGDGVTYKCIPALERLGLLERFMESVEFSTRGYTLGFTDGSDLKARLNPNGGAPVVFVLRRYTFDALLLEGALAHDSVKIMEKTTARGLFRDEAGRAAGVEVEERGGERQRLFSTLIIDASGANSSIAVAAGLGNRDPKRCALALRGYFENVSGLDDTIEIHFDERILPGYFWVFPTSPTTANVGCGTFQHMIEEKNLDLKEILRGFMNDNPLVAPKLKGARLCGALKGGKIPLGMDGESSRVRDGLLLTGDAGAFVNPVTAEGISQAMRTGILAADVGADAIDAGDTSAEGLRAFDSRWKDELGKEIEKAAFLGGGLPKEAFRSYMTHSFDDRRSVDAAIETPGAQYEFMVKLKVLMKSL